MATDFITKLAHRG